MSGERRLAVVGGAAGALGRAVVTRLVADGWGVIAAARHDPQIPGAAFAACDLSDPASVETLARVVVAEGQWAAAVNASGGFAGDLAHRASEEDRAARLDLNLVGPWRLAAAAARAMEDQGGGGRIVNVLGRAAVEVAAGQAVYQVSKAALLRLTEVMAVELRDAGITANAVLPSVMDTPTNRAAMPDADHSRWVPVERVAAVIAWLLSPDAAEVSGAAVPVYGRA
ncbi:MAG TPA: SDR family NAD(P)-dependent oxidoreductase [Candidatus Dormibacteraeota bacterium]|nr:SDR family NAD(P)-dependent oxidoreductase [Candidatus Dormibacteraeota bacterium]